MAEPYVPILDYTTYNTLLTLLEITTNAASANATALAAAEASALASKNSAQNLASNNNFALFLVGA
jgi:hypothetical protein